MRETPQGERVYIGLFGRVNAGKSSLMNAITGQNVSIVSPERGTTTDPVQKTMELLPLGPVTFIDTPGLDDDSALGRQRITRALDVLRKTDIALLVAEGNLPPVPCERALLEAARRENLPALIALSKADEGLAAQAAWQELAGGFGCGVRPVSVSDPAAVHALKEHIAALRPAGKQRTLARDLVPPGKNCVLVVPVDSSAPKGRLILPQQQTIRDLLEGGALTLVVRDREYPSAIARLPESPALVVTDSQVFGFVARHTPAGIPLTSFSMLFARYKGDLPLLAVGVRAVDALQNRDKVLISEGCTHHRQCEDIGSVKIPAWLRAHTGKSLDFSFTSGGLFPQDLSSYRLVIHCGGCMLTEREMASRVHAASAREVPIVNYGVLIAHMNGILERCLQPFGCACS